MQKMSAPPVLDWAQRLQAIAQSGLAYTPQPFDRLRYEDVLDIAVEMMSAVFDADAPQRDALRELFLSQKGHATPKVDVRGVVFEHGRLLLVEEKLDHGRWTLPGGWADIGESAADSTVREIWEETGYRARAVRLLAAYDRNRHDHPPYVFHAYKLFFLCELTQPEREIDPRNVETGEVGWFREDEIGGLELSQGRVTARQIARFFEHLRQPGLPTDFD
jgi:ADP-ribose pyrophosphatase YjhB (NUDIX family)